MTVLEYFAVSGSRFSNADAKVIGPILLQHEGKTLSEVWDYAKSCDPADPFRGYFEWDHGAAWEAHNLERVRFMQQGVKVRRVTSGGKAVETRGFTMVSVNWVNPQDTRLDKRGRPVRVISSIDSILASPCLRENVLAEVRTALIALRSKYRAHAELIGWQRWAALDQTISLFEEEEGQEDTES